MNEAWVIELDTLNTNKYLDEKFKLLKMKFISL